MSLDLTFKQVCANLKKDDAELIDAADKLLGLTLVLSPLALGPAGWALLPLIAVKNELTKLGKTVLNKFTKKAEDDYIARQLRMQTAYGLICYTAFFEALDRQLPDGVRAEIALTKDEKLRLVGEAHKKAAPRSQSQPAASSTENISVDPYSNVPIPFPHPAESLNEQYARLNKLYRQMAQGFQEFVQKLAVWENAEEKKQLQIIKAVEKIPEVAIQCFQAQYFELSRKFEDFAIWANLHEHKETKQLIDSLSSYVRNYAQLAKEAKRATDVGFNKLHEAVMSMPETLKLEQADEIVKGLEKHYHARLIEPIIEEKDDDQSAGPNLAFPKLGDAFVPQSFLVIRPGDKAKALEDEETWSGLARREDLGAFLLSYLSSPYSTESPLIILGHPGSGKSLLTTVLAAQLMSKHYTAIRVPLREVNSDAPAVTQIEEHIGRVTNIKVDSWAKIRAAFKNNPPVVILDGYDELLQASGKVFAGYLKDVQTFQKEQSVQDRPVRVIVTSRVTLIDKAIIPRESTIVRLLDFNSQQRQRWITNWNKTNAAYFATSKVKPFVLPDEKAPDAAKILMLAQQPLLLLMLALYDSEENKLRDSKIRDRTVLYESLLRRFVVRERSKAKEFQELPKTDRAKEVEIDMHRLGIAAIGMYNRRKLHILSSELNDDLKFFDLERKVTVQSGRALSQADLLLGSFFFVHKAKALQKHGSREQHDEMAAFEFLHNTFGEFLTADFIIREALTEIQLLKEFGSNDALRSERDRKLQAADGLSRAWFACLVYTPLFTRPVVLEMIREWLSHVLQRRKLSKKAFIVELDAIVQSQIARVLSKRDMPSIMQKEEAREGFRTPFGPHPLIGHLAIYSVNLILLRSIVGDEVFIFDEALIGSHEDGSRPWDQLTYLWRSWFSLDNLNGLTAIMQAGRDQSSIRIQSKDKIGVAESRCRLETIQNVSFALADNIMFGISGLLLYDKRNQGRKFLENVGSRLTFEGINVDLIVSIKQLQDLLGDLYEGDGNVVSVFEMAGRVIEMAMRVENFEALSDVIFLIGRIGRRVFNYSVVHEYDHGRYRYELERFGEMIVEVMASRAFFYLAKSHREAAGELVRIVREARHIWWAHRVGERFFEDLFYRIPIDMMEDSPELAIAVVELGREWNSPSSQRYEEELFARLIHRTDLIGLTARNPEALRKLIRLLRESSVGPDLDRLGDEVFQQLFQRMHAIEFGERFPELTLELALFAKERGDDRWWETLKDVLVRRAVSYIDVLELLRTHPEDTRELISLLRDVDNGHGIDHVLRRSFDRISPMAWASRNLESAIELLKIVLEVGKPRWMREFGEELLDQPWMHVRLTALGLQKPSVFGSAIKVIRILKSRAGLDAVWRALNALMRSDSGWQSLEGMQVESLIDLRWLMEESGNDEFKPILPSVIRATENAVGALNSLKSVLHNRSVGV